MTEHDAKGRHHDACKEAEDFPKNSVVAKSNVEEVNVYLKFSTGQVGCVKTVGSHH